jgi:hypothetical protein
MGSNTDFLLFLNKGEKYEAISCARRSCVREAAVYARRCSKSTVPVVKDEKSLAEEGRQEACAPVVK